LGSKNRTQATFVDGRACVSALIFSDICSANKCRAFGAKKVEPTGSIQRSSLAAASFSPDGGAWAAGSFKPVAGAERGMIIDLDSASMTVQSVELPITAMSSDVALGPLVSYLYEPASGWTRDQKLAIALGRGAWDAVWTGSTSSAKWVWVAASDRDAQTCTIRQNSNVNCGDTGFAGSAKTLLGAMTGNKTDLFAAGRHLSDIFSRPFIGVQGFSSAPPAGCSTSSSASACSSLTSQINSIHAVDQEAWAVGNEELALRYRSGGWTRVIVPDPSGRDYDFTAVYVLSDSPLVLVAATPKSSDNAVLFAYNRDVDIWTGPIDFPKNPLDPSRIAAILANRDGSQIWFVGSGVAKALDPRERSLVIQVK
jgi:hypothetical protein